jgi:MFS superfamily sulfate permease-like transporter
MSKDSKIPLTGFKGLKENWRNDLIAAFSVALVALPLALGIAVASGMEPMAGVLSAIIGGIVTTFLRGGHVAINGPAAGLIAVILGGIALLDDGSGHAIHYVLAAIVISGGIQVILGLLKMGRLAYLFPSSVIHGILAAIGIIIFSKQMHVAMGTESIADSTLGILIDVFYQLPNINPFVAVISLVGLLMLIFYSKINNRMFHFLPAPMWVLLIAIPFVFLFNFFEPHSMSFLGKSFDLGPQLLLKIPDNPLDCIIYPDFSKIGTLPFWLTVLSITVIASVETLASAKAVDNLDPYKRNTDFNKDLIGVGFSTMVSGAIGGLPIITVIVRSTVNVHHNAKTKWSNFYHGILLIICIIILGPVLQKVPLAALAIILVYTGFKLASPKVLKHTYDQGIEQLFIFLTTIIITLQSNLLYGIIAGILATLTLHMLLAKVGIRHFFKLVFYGKSTIKVLENGVNRVVLKGIANFLATVKLNKMLSTIPKGTIIELDLSNTRLVDLTVMENIIEFKRIHDNQGGQVTITGLEQHNSSTSHNRGLKVIIGPEKKKLTSRQKRLENLAISNGWAFEKEVDWNNSYLQNFHFFETRPIERKKNRLRGTDEKFGILWETSDITFDEGALLSSEVHHTTVHVVRLNNKIPRFAIEWEGFLSKFFDRVMSYAGYEELGFKLHTKFSSKFLVLGEDKEALNKFFTPELIQFLENNKIHHIESNGESLMIFNYLRNARTDEIKKMLSFTQDLLQYIIPEKKI